MLYYLLDILNAWMDYRRHVFENMEIISLFLFIFF